MRLAFFGDVVGKSGRDGITDHLPDLRRDLKLDFWATIRGTSARP